MKPPSMRASPPSARTWTFCNDMEPSVKAMEPRARLSTGVVGVICKSLFIKVSVPCTLLRSI